MSGVFSHPLYKGSQAKARRPRKRKLAFSSCDVDSRSFPYPIGLNQ